MIVAALLAPRMMPTFRSLLPVSDLNERRPKRVTVKTNRGEEKDNPKLPSRRVHQCCKDADRKCSVAGTSLGCKSANQPIFFCRTEPVRCLRSVGWIDENDNAEQNRGKSFPQKEPLPSSKPEQSIQG